jgi:phosphohistidine phosphatase SixA
MIKVLFVRHADIDLPPTSKDPSLNAAGRLRAQALAYTVAHAGIGAIFTSELIRTKQTVAPIAARLSVLAREAPSTLIDDLLAGPDEAVALVAGHSNTVPKMIAALGVSGPPPMIGEADFDNLFVVTANPATHRATLVHLKYGRTGNSP